MNTINVELDNTDLLVFERKPIYNLGKIQPYGVVLVLQEPDLKVLQVSTNSYAFFGIPPEEMLDKSLEEILDPFQMEKLEMGLQQDNLDFINPTKIWARKHGDDYVIFDGVFHRNTEGVLILELEPATSQENIPFLSFYHLARASINQLQETSSLRDCCQIIVQEVRKVTGFDRVMLYKFDDDNHGAVIAEEKLDQLESYLDLHYPASDIPKQARKLLSSNWIRIIPDTKTQPVELYPLNNPINDRPLDLTNSILRSASPCHLDYLHNMGVAASLTISLIEDGKLWGLIACHHLTPKYVSYELRKACEFLGRVIFSEISNRQETEDYDYRMKLSYIGSKLVNDMAQSDHFVSGLINNEANLLDLDNARGAAVCFNGNWTLLGETPAEEDLNFLVQWLYKNIDEEVFTTDSLAKIYPDADKYKNIASGLVAMAISRRNYNYVLWFRPEVIQTVNWAGDPNNAYQADHSQGILHLSPRKSFELWKERVCLKSLPWKQVEVNAVKELKKAIINIVLRKADELARTNQELERRVEQRTVELTRSNQELAQFAYIVSHDLQEPLRKMKIFSQFLAKECQGQFTENEKAQRYLNYIIDAAERQRNTIQALLNYSRLGRNDSPKVSINLNAVIEKVLEDLSISIAETQTTVTVSDLPTVEASATQMAQLFLNLIGNGIKFQGDAPPRIQIEAQLQSSEWLISVQDNGIGINPKYAERIFQIFQRLHSRSEYPGTGIGLANCRKIVEDHGGRIWVTSEPGQGSTFHFTLPVSPVPVNNSELTSNRSLPGARPELVCDSFLTKVG